MALADIRIISAELEISGLRERNGIVRVEFSRVAKINIERLMRLIKENAGKIKLDPKAPNVILLQSENIGLKEKSVYLKEKLEMLAG
jgi:transcription-repair coupling factor (superfamily II helicase)